MKIGYEIKFIQRDACRDSSKHRFTYIYTFISPDTKLKYVVNAEYFHGDVFAIKFYCKQHRRSDFKYSKLTNRGYVRSVLLSCFNVLMDLLNKHPESSFGFSGAHTVDERNNFSEPRKETQRFKVYKILVAQIIGTIQFEHFTYSDVSSYLLVNRTCGNVVSKEIELRNVFIETFSGFE